MNRYFFAIVFSFFFISSLNAETIRIMPVGDSITEDWAFSDVYAPRPDSLKSGYRNYLWYALKAAGHDIDFVGSRTGGSAIRPIFDTDHEGSSGLISWQATHLLVMFEIYKPDIILLHLGTNDLSTKVDAMEVILDWADELKIRVVLAKIINSREPNSVYSAFNNNLESLVRQRNAAGDDIVLVDMEHGAGIYYDSRDFQDRIHPNDSGYRKMANVWFRAVDNIIKNSSNTNTAFLIPAVYSLLLN